MLELLRQLERGPIWGYFTSPQTGILRRVVKYFSIQILTTLRKSCVQRVLSLVWEA